MTQRLTFELADITKVNCHVVVNAANPALAGIGPDLPPWVGGVDGAIHRAAGKALYEFCITLPELYKDEQGLPVRCEPGSCVITPGFKLGKPIIHAVAPRNRDGWQSSLNAMYRRIFDTFLEMEEKPHIAVPAIGTGSYALDKIKAAEIAVGIATDFLETNHDRNVTFCLFDQDALSAYRTALRAKNH